MEDDKTLVIPNKAITELSKSVYNDIGHPVLHEVGNMGAAIMKFVALPFSFLGLTAEELQKKYANFLNKTINKVPQDKCILPKGVVAAPLLDHVKFVFDEENLSEMFSNLLANAMSENIEKMVHPAFVEMLKQMSPLDVEFMYLYFRENDIIEISELTWDRGDGQRALTVDSLSRLGIVNSVSYDNRDDVALMLTDFGRVFRNLCMMNPSEINIDDFFNEDNSELDEGYINSTDIGFMFADSFGTARKSVKDGQIYVRERFNMQDVKNGSSIIILLQINNISNKNQIIDSVYIECEGKKHVITDNALPCLIATGKYTNFIFSVTSENDLLNEIVKENTKYVIKIGSAVYELPITKTTQKEVRIFISNYKKQ